MTIYNYNQINNEFSNYVSQLINNGYMINTTRMHGCFTDVDCFIDFSKQNNHNSIVRIMMVRSYVGSGFDKTEALIIRTSKYSNVNKLSTLWPNKGELISDKIFYEIDRNACYTDSFDELKSISDLRNNRYMNKILSVNTSEYISQFTNKQINIDSIPDNTKKNIIKRIKSVKGFSRANLESIKEISSTNIHRIDNSKSAKGYKVSFEYNGKSDYIILK